MRGAPGLTRQLGALTTGLLLVLIFPGPALGGLAWIALVPLLVAIDALTPPQAFRLGYLAGLVAFGGVLLWMRLFTVPAWLVTTALLAVYSGAFAAGIRAAAGGRRAVLLWAAPLTWVAIEVVRSVGPIGFPWVPLGLSQYRTPAILALAPIVGVFGISGLIVLVNAVVASTVIERRVTLASGAAVLVVLAAIVAANVRPAPAVAPERIVAAVQPNVPPVGRIDPVAASQLVFGLLQQTVEARQAGAEIIVYPESAVPADLATSPDLRGAIAYNADGAMIVTGALMSGPRNGLFVLDPQGMIVGRYAKRRLVPFGEAGIVPGREAATVTTPAGVIGLAICYESAFPFMIRSVARDADLIALLTNDGWFGTSSGPTQHAAHAVMRAAETGRSVIRAANTGTSMLIRPDGTVAGSLPQATRGVLVAALPVGGPATPYVRWGWLLGPLAVAGWLVVAAPLGLAAIRRQQAAALGLAVAIIVPGIAWLVGQRFGPEEGILHWLVIPVMLGAVFVIGRGQLFNRRSVWISAAVSLAVTGVLIGAMRLAYARYGFQMPINPPAAGWGWGGLQLIAGGIALETWLRGAVFASAVRLGGWVFGIITSTALGILIYSGAPQEIVFWHLITGIGFGILRTRTGDAAGLGPARGFGDAAVLSLAGLR